MADIRGQTLARRAMEIAAAGRHHMLFVGPPGAGKTMMARRLPGILPSPTLDESVETTSIYSVAGLVSGTDGILQTRQFRAPHHTVSEVALAGGGREPRPGEVSLAHHGVLFLDEMAEFHRRALEVLRQPIEEGTIRIARAAGPAVFPARFLLVGAMNPCPCGYADDSTKECRCTPRQIDRYHSRRSGPLRDRLDFIVRVAALPTSDLLSTDRGEPSADVRRRVVRAYVRQNARYRGNTVKTNADLSHAQLATSCVLDASGTRLIERAVARFRVPLGDGEPPRLQATPLGGMRYDGGPCGTTVGRPIRYMRCTVISSSARSIASRCSGAKSDRRCESRFSKSVRGRT